VKVKIIIFLLLACLLSRNALAQEVEEDIYGSLIAVKSISDDWVRPIKIYSNKNADFYIGEDTINYNLYFNQNSYREGKFFVSLYIRPKKTSLNKAVNSLRTEIKNHLADTMNEPYPEHLKYIRMTGVFDMRRKEINFGKRSVQVYISFKGGAIAVRDLEGIEKFNPTESIIADKVNAILKRESNDPEVKYKQDAMKNNRDIVVEMSKSAHGDKSPYVPKYINQTTLPSVEIKE
jgi:hypothetical protein